MYNKYKQDEDDFVDIEKLNQEIFKDEKVKEEVESVKEEKKVSLKEEPKEEPKVLMKARKKRKWLSPKTCLH